MPIDKVEKNDQRMIRSLNTPFKRKDPMRMNKTVDSVELAKRRRKSDKNKKIQLFSTHGIHEQSED